MNTASEVITLLRDAGPLDDDEIGRRLKRNRHHINQVCRQLADRQALIREAGPAGKLLNRLPGTTVPTRTDSQLPQRGRSARREIVRRRVEAVKNRFEDYLAEYDERNPFTRSGQWHFHYQTIQLRRQHRSLQAALAADDFIESLYTTLQKWDLGKRGSRLAPPDLFAEEVRTKVSSLAPLEGVSIEDPGLAVEDVATALWAFVEKAAIVENIAKVVAGTKTLLHLLPDLVPPIDRVWTGAFFKWPGEYFQNRQRKIFFEGFATFAEIAQVTRPSQYVGEGWRTCPAKLLDNACIGWLLEGSNQSGGEIELEQLSADDLTRLQDRIQGELERRSQ